MFAETFGQAFNLPGEAHAQETEKRLAPQVAEVITAPSEPPAEELAQQPGASTSEAALSDEVLSSTALSSAASSAANPITSDELAQISDLVSEKFSGLIADELIRVSSNELWLQIELNDSILFTSGNADPSLQAVSIFHEIAAILKNYTNPIQVEGFTDNIPINSQRYPTNWELSSARASAIVKILASQGVAPQRLAAVGYGEFQPLASNATAQGRAQNRRVAIMVAKRNLARPQAPLNALLPAAP